MFVISELFFSLPQAFLPSAGSHQHVVTQHEDITKTSRTVSWLRTSKLRSPSVFLGQRVSWHPSRQTPRLCEAEWQLYSTTPPPPPRSPSSLCRLCSLRGWTTERDSRPQSGWATVACLPACLLIVHDSGRTGNLPFPTSFVHAVRHWGRSWHEFQQVTPDFSSVTQTRDFRKRWKLF